MKESLILQRVQSEKARREQKSEIKFPRPTEEKGAIPVGITNSLLIKRGETRETPMRLHTKRGMGNRQSKEVRENMKDREW